MRSRASCDEKIKYPCIDNSNILFREQCDGEDKNNFY